MIPLVLERFTCLQQMFCNILLLKCVSMELKKTTFTLMSPSPPKENL